MVLGDLNPGSMFQLPGNENIFTLVAFEHPYSFYPETVRAWIRCPWHTWPPEENYQKLYWDLGREVIPVQLTLF